ncbi:MAG: hypothetical protein DHS20C21_11140 [Gemmatimonadota bacterium]|nr:MAG: hypothetical protein DHS20C21_11140 [Gemmatimonadota bacterium]
MLLRKLTIGIMYAILFCLFGCLAEPSGQSDPKKFGPDPDPDPDPDAEPMSAAFYTLTGAHLRDEAWPDAWSEYSVFVCNASLPAETVATAKESRPDARFLAYTNVADIYNGSLANPYWAAFHAAFDSTLYVRDLNTDTVVRLFGADGTPGSGHGYFVMRKPSADILVAFHRDVTLAAGFDGLYLDNCTADVPNWRLDLLAGVSNRVDIDNDGVADPQTIIPDVYGTWRPYYTEQLRAAVGPDRILVGNSGGALEDATLNGITLEGVGDRFDVVEASNIFESQRAVGTAPFLGVAWVTTPASDLPTRELVPAVNGLHYGFIAE